MFSQKILRRMDFIRKQIPCESKSEGIPIDADENVLWSLAAGLAQSLLVLAQGPFAVASWLRGSGASDGGGHRPEEEMKITSSSYF